MATINYENAVLNWSIDSEIGFNIASPGIQAFLTSLTALHDISGTLTSFTITKSDDVYRMAIEPMSFEINFQYVESHWTQKFKSSNWIDTHICDTLPTVIHTLLNVLIQYQITSIDFKWA